MYMIVCVICLYIHIYVYTYIYMYIYICVCSACFRATGRMLEDDVSLPKVYMKSFRRESEKHCPFLDS